MREYVCIMCEDVVYFPGPVPGWCWIVGRAGGVDGETADSEARRGEGERDCVCVSCKKCHKTQCKVGWQETRQCEWLPRLITVRPSLIGRLAWDSATGMGPVSSAQDPRYPSFPKTPAPRLQRTRRLYS